MVGPANEIQDLPAWQPTHCLRLKEPTSLFIVNQVSTFSNDLGYMYVEVRFIESIISSTTAICLANDTCWKQTGCTPSEPCSSTTDPQILIPHDSHRQTSPAIKCFDVRNRLIESHRVSKARIIFGKLS